MAQQDIISRPLKRVSTIEREAEALEAIRDCIAEQLARLRQSEWAPHLKDEKRLLGEQVRDNRFVVEKLRANRGA
jgi:hypothetical protein